MTDESKRSLFNEIKEGIDELALKRETALPCCGAGMNYLQLNHGTLTCGACTQVFAPTTIAFRKALKMDAYEQVAQAADKLGTITGPEFAKHIRTIR